MRNQNFVVRLQQMPTCFSRGLYGCCSVECTNPLCSEAVVELSENRQMKTQHQAKITAFAKGFLAFRKCISKARVLKGPLGHATKAVWMGFLGEKRRPENPHQNKPKKKSPCPPSGFEISIPNTKMIPWARTALFQLLLLCPA